MLQCVYITSVLLYVVLNVNTNTHSLDIEIDGVVCMCVKTPS